MLAAQRPGSERCPESSSGWRGRSTPASELLEAAKDADLLVIGSRGSGGFGRLMLGSVSTQLVHHASCPVVVIPWHDKG